MADKNYRSYNGLSNQSVFVGPLTPRADGWVKWDDTMKTYKCNDTVFHGAIIDGGEEDVLDVGTHTNNCVFQDFDVFGDTSRYLITLKSHSEGNVFERWRVHEHSERCDIQQGNWSDSDNGSNSRNLYREWVSEENKPITYSYRFFSGSKPQFQDMEVKHLWWLSLGVTLYCWGKWVWTKVRRR
jgi:hypothetical protein